MSDNMKNKSYKKASAFTIIVSFLCVALAGLALVPMLPVKLNPARTLPGFSVRFSMPGASAQVVEIEATSKLESMLSRIKGIKNINSVSDNGWGSITIDLDKYADPELVRFEASTIIRQTWPELPDGVSYPYLSMKLPDENTSRPFMTFTINAPSTPILIQQYAEEHIKSKLAKLQGIYKIDVSGATPMEWMLEYDNEQLRTLGISLSEISQAVRDFYEKEFMGIYNIESASGGKEWIRLLLVPKQKSEKAFDPTLIWIRSANGSMIRLDELVKVSYQEEKPHSYYRINGLNSIYMSITAEESANQLQLSQKVEEELEKIRQGLPPGYEIYMSYNATEYIQQELDKIYFRTGLTVLILLLFVLLITLNLKYLWLIVVSLSVNIAIAFIFYYWFGLEMQLYSLAGITISLNLVLDNTIVMTDHYLRRKDLKVFMSILAATLTTMGALVIIFFLDERIRLNLQDFAAVVMINLAVSLFVALFFVPSLIEKIGLKKQALNVGKWGHSHAWLAVFRKIRRFPVHFSRFYGRLIRFMCRWRVAVCLFFLLLFGLPVFMMPERMDGKGRFVEWYNAIFGSEIYSKIRPVVDNVLGGSLRLFVQNVYEGSYLTRKEEVVLHIAASMPNGSTLEQMNVVIKKMEAYLSQYKEIRQFHTDISNAQRASIDIYFKKEYEKTEFPYTLEEDIIGKVLELGGSGWTVYGLKDTGFSNNSTREDAGSFRVKMYGYNYDELYYWAEKFKEKLLTHRRIKEVTINSEFSYWKDDYQEFYFDLDKERMLQQGISASRLFGAISPIFGQDIYVTSVDTDTGTESIKLSSKQSGLYDSWALQHFPYESGGNIHKLSELATIEKGLTPRQIAKENQQYRLCLQYEYIGPYGQGGRILKRDLKEFNEQLPMGYSAQSEQTVWKWGGKDYKQYLLLLIVVGIIFFITSILFNSVKVPLAVILVIPVSYIGVFLTFYGFGLNFDQGGFASFVLLCGITVNASIYILNEYVSLRRRFPKMPSLRAYIKAWNTKIIPIFLTVVSTILGFIPFMVGTGREAFWFPLAAGTIGGLAMSLLGVFVLLPVLALKKDVLQPKN